MIIKKQIESRYKITFVATFIWGLLAHLYAMVNMVAYHDGLLVERVGATYVSGRWFLGLLGEKGLIGLLFGTYNIPFMAGLFFLFWIALTNIMLVDLLNIQDKKICVALCGGG